MRKKCCPKRKKDGTRIPSFLIYHVLREYGRINKIGLHLIKETVSGDFELQQFRFSKGFSGAVNRVFVEQLLC
jgi:hypothetical protein